jgi:hypothetical protein
VMKVIFLCVDGCPQFNSNGDSVFDGNFGICKVRIGYENKQQQSQNHVGNGGD